MLSVEETDNIVITTLFFTIDVFVLLSPLIEGRETEAV